MRIPLRATVLTLALSLVYGGFVLACPGLTRDLGLDLWNASGDSAELEQHKRESHELENVSERVKKRLEMKEILVGQLVDERIDLKHAVEQFMALNELQPELTSYLRIHFAGNTDEERTARQVIAFTKATLAGNPSLQEVVIKRLELQLRDLQGRQQVALVH